MKLEPVIPSSHSGQEPPPSRAKSASRARATKYGNRRGGAVQRPKSIFCLGIKIVSAAAAKQAIMRYVILESC